MAYRIAAVLILLVFYGCYFAKMLQQRKQGVSTDQLGKGKQGFVLFVEVTLKVISIAVPLAETLAVAQDVTALSAPWRIAGLILAALGDCAFLAAVLTMRDSWRAGVSYSEKTELVTRGIYGFSRNPAFLGFDLVYIGILAAFFSLWLFVLTADAVLIFHLQIVNVEEPFLQEIFGQSYLDYRKQTCRYFGRKYRHNS